MDLELRNAAIEFFRRTRIWCVWLDPITAESGLREYDFDLPTMATVSRIEAVKVNGTPVDVASYKDAGPLTGSTDASKGLAFGSAMGTLVMSDLYAAGALIEVQSSLVPARNAVGVEDALFEAFANEIAEGAKSRLMLLPGQAFSNDSKAGIANSKFEDAVATRSVESWLSRVHRARCNRHRRTRTLPTSTR